MEAREYEKLVKALRICSSELNCGDCPLLYRDSCSSDELMNDAAAAIEELQAEVERLEPKRGEVVRCGECKWYSIYEAKKDGTPDKRYSPSVCLREIYAKRRDPDWFCADGERKVQDEGAGSV